ncbi:hypothetical protein EFP23_10495 [Lacticaseibacillus paracasei]|nr:hypothetical protein [Lacticaseibacillus paracasei]MCT3344975.1 hypothetical protein [Lacticaseibacillus paracasei]QHC82757.1 hypothetical protein F5J09_00825 [Lacticaseibacillus paracasei]RDF80874.1 hypothetical protein DQM24_10925 [Lacticaseibacillus paracasei]RDG20841.1 hypothetical protein DQM17_12280 [Lacticaseibacillus paracasei]
MPSLSPTRDTPAITRSPALKPACKDLRRNDQRTVITPKATYTSVPPALAHAHFKGGIYDGSHFDPARSYRSWRVLSGHCQYNATGFLVAHDC